MAVVAVPPENPSLTMTFPEAWKTRGTDYGYIFVSPGRGGIVDMPESIRPASKKE